MALTKQSLTITRDAAAGTITFTIGHVTHTMPMHHLNRGVDGEFSYEFLLGQIVAVIANAGINPRSASAALIKSTIEAGQYWLPG